MPGALDRLKMMLGDVDNLIDHHPKASAPARGRPTSDEGPLLRSCIVLTYAAWEVYVEDSMIDAANALAKCAEPENLPQPLRDHVATWVSPNPWRLAGDAWRDVVVTAVTEHVRGNENDDHSFGINSAGPRQVNQLHDKLLGVRLLEECRWQRMTSRRVKEELADLVKIRGAVVHSGMTPGPLNLKGVREWRDFVLRLGQTMDAQLDQWLASQQQARKVN